MLRVLIWVLEVIALLWLLRLLWRTAAGWLGFPDHSAHSRQSPGPAGAGPPLAPRELKKDPQCGTYVSPEVSVRARFGGEELHFCSRECEEKFRHSQSAASA